jgi:hypothetical protein
LQTRIVCFVSNDLQVLSGSKSNGVTRVTLGFRGDLRRRAREFVTGRCVDLAYGMGKDSELINGL